jgi:hypothetical protein
MDQLPFRLHVVGLLRKALQVPDREELWQEYGLHQFQVVQCQVVEHRGRFGVDVEVFTPNGRRPAFIDFVLLAEAGEPHVTPENFPPVGAILRAVTVDFMPDGELRLSARASGIARYEQRDSGDSGS